MDREEKIIHNCQVMIGGQILNFEETIDLLCKTKSFLDEANVRLSQHEKEKHDMECQIDELKTYISELETELRVKEDLFKIKNAISNEPTEKHSSRPSIEWYEDRYQSDCITINQLHTTIDVLTDKLARLRGLKMDV